MRAQTGSGLRRRRRRLLRAQARDAHESTTARCFFRRDTGRNARKNTTWRKRVPSSPFLCLQAAMSARGRAHTLLATANSALLRVSYDSIRLRPARARTLFGEFPTGKYFKGSTPTHRTKNVKRLNSIEKASLSQSQKKTESTAPKPASSAPTRPPHCSSTSSWRGHSQRRPAPRSTPRSSRCTSVAMRDSGAS